jgi:predicted ATPase
MTMVKMLTGDFEALIPGPIISEEHLNRLWHYLPGMLDALVNYGPDLAQQFLTESHQFNIAKEHPGVAQDTLALLTALSKYSPKNREKPVALNDQFNQVFSALSESHPLILVLDDLQWIDEGSASLLFHLGRQLGGKKVLLLGAFRPSEVTITYDEITHPLFGILRELRAIYGENMVNMAESKGDLFINDLLASEPNAFTTDFHQKLYRHTSGHPLFTIELLRGMQLRNEIIKDKRGNWVESKVLNWEELPPRVEAVIARRFGLLPAECQSIMKPACVQGKAFCVEILSKLVSEPEQKVFDLLNEVVGKRHQLITPQGIQQVGKRQTTYFRFRHDLFQIYLYGQLNPVERKRLHGLIGHEIENLYDNQLSQYPEMVHTLAWHFENSDNYEKATQYYMQAGKFAGRLSAHQDAIRHFNHALELVDHLPDSTKKDELELDLQLSLGPPLTALKGWGAQELEKAYDRAQTLCENIKNPGKLIPALWLLATFRLGRSEHMEVDRLVARLEALIRQINDPALLAMVYLQVSPLYQGKLVEARVLLERAAAVNDIKLQRHLTHRFGMAPAAVALSYLSNCLWIMGYPDQAGKVNIKALTTAEKIDHPMTTCYVTSRSCWLGLLKDDLEQVGTNTEVLYQISHKFGLKNFEFAALFFKNWLKFQNHEDQDLALDAMQKNIEAYYVTKTVLNRTGFLVFFGQACLEEGLKERGLDAVNQSLSLGDETGELWFQAEAWRVKGELLLIIEEDRQANKAKETEALECFMNAYRIAGVQKAKMWELRAAVSMAGFYKTQNQTEKARKILNDTYQWFTEGFETKDLEKAKSLFDSL